MIRYKFKVWIPGISTSLESGDPNSMYFNLDNKKLYSSFFNAMAIKLGPDRFIEMAPETINPHFLKTDMFYLTWKRMSALDMIIYGLGLQYDARSEREIPFQKFDREVFEEMYVSVYIPIREAMASKETLEFEDDELEFLLQVEKCQRAQLVLHMAHRYERYNKYWKIFPGDSTDEMFKIEGKVQTVKFVQVPPKSKENKEEA